MWQLKTDFQPSMLQRIPRSNHSFTSYLSNKLELFDNNTSLAWNGKNIIGVTIPILSDNKIIGHVWAEVKTEDVYREVFFFTLEDLTLTEFLSLSKNNPVDLRRHNLNNILKKLLPMLQADSLKRENNLELELGEISDMVVDEKEIRQVILNLARNGLESMSTQGVLTIKTYVEDDQIVMAFKDQGSGIPAEILANIGKPFLTTKDNGTGLGLPVSYSIVHRYGGTISIDTGTEGTTFLIKLPISIAAH